MSRRKSRIIAFQALYSWDVGGVTQEDILKCEWVEEKDSGDPEELSFARLLIAGTFENIKKIDEVITAHLSPKWDFSNLPMQKDFYKNNLDSKKRKIVVIISDALRFEAKQLVWQRRKSRSRLSVHQRDGCE